MKEMKQNKNSSVVLRVASATLAAVFLFCSLSIPSFAVSTNGLSFTGQPLPIVTSSSDVISSGLYAGYTTRSSTETWKYYFGSYNSPDDVYCFAVTSGTYISFVLASRSQGNYVYNAHGSGSDYINTSSSNYFSSVSPVLFYHSHTVQWAVASSSTFLVPTFDSIEDGLNAVNAYIDSGGGGLANPVSLTKDVPAGNALYIQIPTNATVSISCSMSSEVAHPQSWITNQYWGTASGYPSSISGNPSGSTPISWNGYGDKTIFNRYKSFYWNGTVSSSDGYIFIVNPYASIDEYDQSFNPTIYVTVDQAKGYKYYQLTGGISSNGTIGQQSDGTTASGEYDSNTGQWTSVNDETGLPWSPSEGGGNLITTNSINDWLRTIATQISNFFQGAIGAVTTLVSAGSAFINQLISLYSWLPAPVYAVLSSALIIVITIGVIKVFV